MAAKGAERLANEKVKMSKAAENAAQILANMQEKERAKEGGVLNASGDPPIDGSSTTCVIERIADKVDEGKGKGKGQTEAAAVIKVSHISNCDPIIQLTGHDQKSSSCETNIQKRSVLCLFFPWCSPLMNLKSFTVLVSTAQ